MNDNFKNIINGESKLVDSIISLMFHSKKDEARRLLMLLNEIIDFYLSKKNDDTHFPIVHIPNCPEWAEAVFTEFLVLKLALSYNDEELLKLKALKRKEVYLTSNNKKANIRMLEYRRYVSKICKTEIPTTSYTGKNLLFVPLQILNASRGNKNEYLSELTGGYNNLNSESNLTICTEIGQKEIDEITYDNEKLGDSISNIFIIYRNSEQCNSLTKQGIERAGLNNVKNCFIFIFSSKPQCLYKTRARMITLGHSKFECLATEKEALNNDNFITLTEKESLSLFKKSFITQHVFIDDDQFYYNGMIGEYVGTADFPILERNHLSLCLSETMCDVYLKKAKANFEGMDDEFSLSMEYQKEIAQNVIIPRILEFIGNENRVAFVLPHDVSKQEKDCIKLIFGDGRALRFYVLSHLSPKNGEVAIKEKCIVNLTYRGHFANTLYHKYPNSFDPYILKSDQRILDIVHGFAFNNIREWDLYDYKKLLFQYTDNAFRRHYSLTLPKPERPLSVKENYDVEPDETQSRRNNVQSHTITFVDGEKVTILDSDLLISLLGEEAVICKFSELTKDLSSLQGVRIQKLSDLDEVLKAFMEKKTKRANQRVQTLRTYYVKIGRLSIEDESSGDTIWNILLRKKVNLLGVDVVYNELMSPLSERERISLVAFKVWYAPHNSMLLPLMKKTQKRLIEYLELPAKYLDAMRAIKRSAKANSKAANQMIDRFMMDFLFNEITNEKFEEFKESPINESLQIVSISDFDALIELIKEKIQLKEVANNC